MAIIKGGIHGMISGKIGEVIFSNYQGKQVIKSVPSKSRRRPTEAQIAQKMRFTIISSYFASIKTLIGKGHGSAHKCISYHLKNATTGIFPDLEIDQSKVVLTKGRLPHANNAIVACLADAVIAFNWKSTDYFDTDDEAILIVYNPHRQQHVWCRTSVKRAAEFATLTVPARFSGQTVHCWIAFISRDGKQFSNSSYLGEVEVL